MGTVIGICSIFCCELWIMEFLIVVELLLLLLSVVGVV